MIRRVSSSWGQLASCRSACAVTRGRNIARQYDDAGARGRRSYLEIVALCDSDFQETRIGIRERCSARTQTPRGTSALLLGFRSGSETQTKKTALHSAHESPQDISESF